MSYRRSVVGDPTDIEDDEVVYRRDQSDHDTADRGERYIIILMAQTCV